MKIQSQNNPKSVLTCFRKQLLVFCTFIFSLTTTLAQFQGFENWTSDSLMILKNYATTSEGARSTTQSNDAHDGLFSIKVETIIKTGGDTSYGFFIDGDMDANIAGQAINLSNVDSIIGFYKSNIKLNDSSLLICMISKNSANTGGGLFYFKGIQTVWTRFAFATHALTCDSLIFGAVSADAAHNSKGLPGSWLMLDNVQLKAANGSMVPLINNSFENWDKVTWETPLNWNTTSARVFGQPFLPVVKTLDSYSGNHAMELTTRNNIQTGEKIVAIATNGILAFNGITGGQSIAGAPTRIELYYKYSPIGSDSAFVHFDFHNNGQSVEKISKGFSAKSGYTFFSQNLMTTNADSVLIILFAGTVPGSKLKVDAINLVFTMGITNLVILDKIVSYPNPSRDFLNIRFSLSESANITLRLTDFSGKELDQRMLGYLENGEYTESFNVAKYNSGLYYLELVSGENRAIHRFLIK